MRALEKQRIRSELLECAMEMMHRSDKHTFSLRKLAKEYGMAPSNIYHYFKNKEEIMDQIFPYLHSRIVDEIFLRLEQEEKTVMTAKDQLIRVAMAHIEIMKEHPAYEYLILIYPKDIGKKRIKRVESYKMDWFHQMIKKAIQESRMTRSPAEEMYICQQWTSIINGIIYTWCGKIIDYTSEPNKFIEMFLRDVIYPMVFQTNETIKKQKIGIDTLPVQCYYKRVASKEADKNRKNGRKI